MNVQNKYIPFGCSYDCNWCVKYYYSSTAQQIRQSQCKDRISDGCGHIWMYFYSLSFLLLCEDERGSDYSGKRKISVKIQLKAVMQNRPYLLALAGQILFGFTLYGRNADILYYFTYVEGNASYYTTYSMCIIIPSIIGAACFQPLFRKLNNKGRTASLFALFTGISMLSMFFFNAKESPAIFMHYPVSHSSFSLDLIPQSMQLFQTVWNMGSGKPDLEMTVFSMHLFHLEIKSEWQLEQHF